MLPVAIRALLWVIVLNKNFGEKFVQKTHEVKQNDSDVDLQLKQVTILRGELHIKYTESIVQF